MTETQEPYITGAELSEFMVEVQFRSDRGYQQCYVRIEAESRADAKQRLQEQHRRWTAINAYPVAADGTWSRL